MARRTMAMVGVIALAAISLFLIVNHRLSTPCFEANKLLGQGSYSRANDKYGTLLDATPSLKCAENGSATAEVALLATTNAEATATAIAKQEWESLPGNVQVIVALRNAGFNDEANKVAIKEIKKDPNIEIPEAKKAESNTNILDGKGWNQLNAGAKWLADHLQAIGLLAVFALAGRWIIQRAYGVPDLDIALLKSESLKPEVGKVITEAIQIAYSNTQHSEEKDQSAIQADGPKLIIEAQPSGASTAVVADVLSTPAGIISSIMKWLQTLRIPPYILEGTVISDPGLGVGMILTLTRKNQIISTEEVWFKTYFNRVSVGDGEASDTTQDLLALSQVTGIWLFNEMKRIRPINYDSYLHWKLAVPTDFGKRQEGIETTRKSLSSSLRKPLEVNETEIPTRPRGLHTKWWDWRSYAYFKASGLMLKMNDRGGAIALLHESLNLDDHFLPALLNLYTLEMEQAVIEALAPVSDAPTSPTGVGSVSSLRIHFEDYYDRMEALWSAVAESDVLPRVRGLVYYNYRAATDYLLGWDFDQDTLRAVLGDDPSQILDVLSSIQKESGLTQLALLHEVLSIRYLSRDDTIPAGQQDHNLRMLAPVIGNKEPSIIVARDEYPNLYGSSNQYMLACRDAAMVHRTDDQESKYTWAFRGFNHLKQSLSINPNARSWAMVDPSLEPLRKYDPDRFKATVGADDSPSPQEEDSDDSECTCKPCINISNSNQLILGQDG